MNALTKRSNGWMNDQISKSGVFALSSLSKVITPPRHRRSRRIVVCLMMLATAPCAWAQLTGGQVSSGSAQIAQTGQTSTTTTITQSTETATINWKTFNVGASDVVNFVQPSRQSLTINRIADTNGSTIMGRIHSNGQVWLINPNGVLFGKGAQVNVGSILAAALAVTDPQGDRAAGNWSINASDERMASVINQGQIQAAQDGYVALLAHRVSNTGSITAPSGTVALGGGTAISVQFQKNKLLGIEVNQQQLDAMVSNSGLINADGGQVLLSAGTHSSLLASAVNNVGQIQARTVSMQQGKVVLSAGKKAGQVKISGSIDVSAPTTGDGGEIEISAAKVQLNDGWQANSTAANGLTGDLRLSAAQWTVQRQSSDVDSNAIRGEDMGKLLASNNLTLRTDPLADTAGDIALNGAVTWNAPTTLSLQAAGDIYVNDVLTSKHASGTLRLAYGLGSSDGVIAGKQADYWISAPVNIRAGQNFYTQLGASGPVKAFTVITELGKQGSTTGTDLQGISQASDKLAMNYVLGADIDASATVNWSKGAGFRPLFTGNADADTFSFQGTFDGLGHVISGLVIKKPKVGVQALFASLGRAGVIRNTGLRNIAYDTNNTGGLVFRNYGVIRNSFVDGGYLKSGDNFDNLSNFIGGLVGDNQGQIIDSYANVNVSMQDTLGNFRTEPRYVYRAGGLVGINSGTIVNSYATGVVLVSNRTVTTNGVVSPVVYGGGLVGSNVFDAEFSGSGIRSSYWIAPTSDHVAATGPGWQEVSRAVGVQNTPSPQPDSAYTLSAAQASQASTFANWDIDRSWLLYEGQGRPYLRAFMTPLYVQVSNVAQKVYDGSRFIDVASSTMPQGLTKSFGGVLVAALQDKNAGNQKVIASGLYSDQWGYQVRYEFDNPTVLVSKANLEVRGITGVDKSYDSTNQASLNTSAMTINGLVAGDDVSVGVTGRFQSKDAGIGKQVLIDGQLSGADRNNYALVLQAQTVADIEKASLRYVANPSDLRIGDSLEKLTGVVVGFVGDDSQTTTARGVIHWKSNADSSLKPGVFGVFGSGLAFDNYVLSQASSNEHALRISAFETSATAQRTVTRIAQDHFKSGSTLTSNAIGSTKRTADSDDMAPNSLNVFAASRVDSSSATRPAPSRAISNSTCIPVTQSRSDSVRITCQPLSPTGSK